jgi:hypothetical protein
MQDNEFDAQERSSTPVIPVNQKARLVVIVVGVLGALAGAAAIRWLLPYSQQYLSAQEPQAALRTMQILFACIFLSVLPVGIYLFWFGYRAVKWRQVPPPGTWVIRNTRIVEGDPARRRGWVIMALGGLLFALGLFSALYLPYRLGKVFHVNSPATEQSKAR